MATKRSLNGQVARPAARRRRVDVGAIRRDQIIDAATAVIAEEGIQNLSLSGIESRTGMSRGQLTYYFREKEHILLAVFDRMVERMRARMADADRAVKYPISGDAQAKSIHILDMLLHRPAADEFTALQYTFLAQVRHRRDFRERLANLYSEWRQELMDGMPKRKAAKHDSRTLASLVQAVFHGLVIQMEADPSAFDRAAMTRLCLSVFSSIMPTAARIAPRPRTRKGAKNV